MKIEREEKTHRITAEKLEPSHLAGLDHFQVLDSFFCHTGSSIEEISHTSVPRRAKFYSLKSRKLLEIQLSDAILEPILIEASVDPKKGIAYLQSEQRIRAISRFAIEGVPTHLLFQITLRVINSNKVTFHDAFRFVTYKDFVGLLKYETERGTNY